MTTEKSQETNANISKKDDPTGEALAKLEAKLAGYDGPDRVVSSREFWEIEATKPIIERKFKTGITSLDSETGIDGVETGEVVVVSGLTGQGKTTLCDTFGREMTRNGINCVWFSFEVTPRKFMAKYQPLEAEIIYVPLERKPGSLEWIEHRVLEAKLKYDCRVVFIDHLHFVVNIQNLFKSSSIEIGVAMRYIKSEIALKHNVAVFLIAHLAKTKFEEEPGIDDLRDSSFVGQEADDVLIVYRKTDKGKKVSDDNAYSNRAILKICKARRAGTLNKRIKLIKLGNDLVEEEEFAEDIEQRNYNEPD